MGLGAQQLAVFSRVFPRRIQQPLTLGGVFTTFFVHTLHYLDAGGGDVSNETTCVYAYKIRKWRASQQTATTE